MDSPGVSPPIDPEVLVERHLGLVEAIARKTHRSLPKFVELDDLIGFGNIGLVEASRRFDAARGVQFKTFAYYRIRGAIFDGIRRMSWFTENPTHRVRFEAASHEILEESAMSRRDSDVPVRFEESIDQQSEVIASIATAYLLSLNTENPIDVVDATQDPHADAEVNQSADRVRALVARLPEKERQVVEGYYFESMTLEEVGARIGLSKSWVSRVHQSALARLVQLCRDSGLETSR